MSENKYNGVIRAFWRRIEPFKNNYGKELPDELPIEFVAHFNTAMSALDLSSDIEFVGCAELYGVSILKKGVRVGIISRISLNDKFIVNIYGNLPSDATGNDYIAIGRKLNELNELNGISNESS